MEMSPLEMRGVGEYHGSSYLGFVCDARGAIFAHIFTTMIEKWKRE